MISLSTLQSFLDDLMHFDKKLNVSKIDVQMSDGLVVKGKEEIKKIGFGVSASLKLFHLAMEKSCDALIVHHSISPPPNSRYDQIFQDRIEYLLKNRISLFGYHFLLDAHPNFGNNVQIIKTINAKLVKPYYIHNEPWGWIGEYEEEINLEKILEILKPLLSRRILSYDFGPLKIKKIAAISGKGAPYPEGLQNLLDNKIDLFITGEAHEWTRELFREAKINFLAGGHYHTERFGIKALMLETKRYFKDICVEWIELENDI